MHLIACLTLQKPASFTVRIHLIHLCTYNAQQIVQCSLGDQFKFTDQVNLVNQIWLKTKVFSLICVEWINTDINTEI